MHRSIIGDSFPDADFHQADPSLGVSDMSRASPPLPLLPPLLLVSSTAAVLTWHRARWLSHGEQFGMGQWAKYMFVLPSKNLTVVSIGQSKGGSLDCTGAYNDGCASRPALPTSPMLATPALCTSTVLAAMKMVAVPDDEHR